MRGGFLFLSNFWQWSGSFAQYVNWVTGENIPDPDKPVMAKGDWRRSWNSQHGLQHKHPLNYIAVSSLASSIAATPSTAGFIAVTGDHDMGNFQRAASLCRRQFGRKMCPFLRLGGFNGWIHPCTRPGYLVCTGSEGIWGCLQKPESFHCRAQTSAIDYVTVHMWLKNWSWINTVELGTEFETAANKARDHVENAHQRLRRIL